MNTINLPTYAIVELLIRVTPFNSLIGHYKNHSINNDGAIVNTSSGSILIPESLIIDQFKNPEMVTEKILLDMALSFKPF